MVRALARIVLAGLFGFESSGEERVPRRGGVVLAANHASYLDPAIVACGLRRREVAFMARSTLFVGWFGKLIAALKSVPVERDASDRRALRAIVAALRDGQAVLIFPEGTRTADGAIGRCKAGAALAARLAGVPVVPVAIDGSFEAWPRQKGVFRIFRPVRVRYGRPVRYASPGLEAVGSDRPGGRAEVEADLRMRLVDLLAELRGGPGACASEESGASGPGGGTDAAGVEVKTA